MTHSAITHQPARIRVELQTSLRMGRFPVALDGLLWHALFLKTGCPDAALEKLAGLVSSEQGVFRASAMAFGIYNGSKHLIATHNTTVGTMRSDSDLQPEQFHPTGRRRTYPKLQIEGGPYRNRLNRYQTYYAPEVCWDAIADAETVCDLLNFFVQGIGLEANRGFGAVSRFRWEPMDTDSSWKDANQTLTRVLPEPLARQILDKPINERDRTLAQTTPPYRNTAMEPCVAPPRIRQFKLTPPAH